MQTADHIHRPIPPPPEHLLAPEPDRPRYVRSPQYVLRAVAGAVLMALGFGVAVLFENALIGLAIDARAMVSSWPEPLEDAPLLVLAAVAGALVAGTNAWLLATRHFRRVAVLAAAGIGAIALRTVLIDLALSASTSDLFRSALAAAGGSIRFGLFLPSLVAVVTVGLPWIRRRFRPWVIAGAAAFAFSLLFFAIEPPLTLLMDVGAGIVVGSLVGLAVKSPNQSPTRAEIALALVENGIGIEDLARAQVDARGSAPWFATTIDGERLFIKVMEGNHRAADLLFRLYRWLRYRHAGDRRPFASLRRSVEHEALAALQAGSRGISTPQLLAVTEVGLDGFLLAYEAIEGRSLDVIDPDEMTDDMLAHLWSMVTHLHMHGIAHRDLRLANMMLTDEGELAVIDFGFAELAADEMLLARDVAELIGSTAGLIGPERAVAAAAHAVEPDRLLLAAAFVQPAAVSSATAGGLTSEQFERLRQLVLQAVGADTAASVKIERVSLRSLLALISLGLAAVVLIPLVAESSDLASRLTTAKPAWVAGALVASVATYVGAATGIMGTVPCPLPVRGTVIAQLASSFSNRVTPAKVGGMATNVRYLTRLGVPAATAVAAIGYNSLAGVMIHIPATVATGLIAGRRAGSFPLPSASTLTLVVLGAIGLSGLVMLLPRGRTLLRDNLWPAVKAAVEGVQQVATAPAKLAQLFGGSFLVTTAYVAAMAMSLRAFGDASSLATVAFVYLAGSAVATAAPTPGGAGATEAVLAAGYSAVGIAPDVAVGAVLLFRALTFWLPILPGWLAFSWMQRTGRL